MRRTLALLGVWWVVLFLLWVAFVSTLSTLELAVGAGASGAAAVLGALLARWAPAGPRRVARAAALAWAWPGTLLAETGRFGLAVAAALRGRAPAGRFVRQRLRPGQSPGPAGLLLSATPGSLLVAAEQDGQGWVLTMHSLFPEAGSPLDGVLLRPEAEAG